MSSFYKVGIAIVAFLVALQLFGSAYRQIGKIDKEFEDYTSVNILISYAGTGFLFLLITYFILMDVFGKLPIMN